MGILGGSQAGVRPGAGSATLARILGVFRGAAGLLINVFFGQVLVCFFVRRRGGFSGGAGARAGEFRGVAGFGVLWKSSEYSNYILYQNILILLNQHFYKHINTSSINIKILL